MTGQNDKISAVFLIGHVRVFQIINKEKNYFISEKQLNHKISQELAVAK